MKWHNREMWKLSWVRTALSVATLFLAAVVLQVCWGWMFGEPPHIQFKRLLYNDIPRFTVPVRLMEGTPVSFQARVVRKYGHELNLLVHFGSKAERTVVQDLVGGPIALPRNEALPQGKLRTTVRVTVTDQEERVVFDQTRSSDAHVAVGMNYLVRELARLPPLKEGLYTINVTPLNDVSALVPLRTELEVTYSSK